MDILQLVLVAIGSAVKSNLSCPSGYIATGYCGDWKCGKEIADSLNGNPPAIRVNSGSMMQGASEIMPFVKTIRE